MSLMRTSYGFTILWTMAFIFFFAYFFVTASIVAFEDGFDETTREKGYPEDFKFASKWTKEEYVVWIFSWLPSKYLEKLCEKIGYEDYMENIYDEQPPSKGEEDDKKSTSTIQ